MDNRFIQGRKREFYDTMFQSLSNQKSYYSSIKNYGAMSITCLHIYEIMSEEYRKTEHNVPIDVLLLNYIEHLYIDTCFTWEAKHLSEGIVPHVDCIYMPRIKADLSDFFEYKGIINFNVVFANKPPSFLKKEDFISFINSFFETSIFDYTKWDNLLRNNFKEYTKLFDVNE